ncbi:hypothetical protein HHK36_003832 [Tetracentron sinense]|uniref:VQ domain-containing protein n=1 Tax=Tetracentron sinense TaxID=13715 RepID=A0A834ZT77_TETSI|nr:hypothetical protein HHK36_003832 [Tetracentron sinense]
MAMSETMLNPSDWVQFYQRNLAGQVAEPDRRFSNTMFDDRVSKTSVVTSASSPRNLSPEGRVSKPARKRTRASRKTPTTLLNTDPTNFRAMVQQFTGGPSASISSGPRTSATTLSFGLGNQQQHLNANPITEPSGYYYRQLQQQYLLSLNNYGSDALLQRLSNSARPNLETSDHGFVMEGISSDVLPRPFL